MPKILVIEDDTSTRELMRIRLEANQYEVITAKDGIEGLDKASKERPNLIILDIMMPNMDGCAFVEGIKNMEDIKYIPIIVTSEKDNLQNFLVEAGVNDYMLKPIDIEVLLDKVKIILTRANEAGEG